MTDDAALLALSKQWRTRANQVTQFVGENVIDHTSTIESDVLTIRVFRDEDQFAAEWITADKREAGMGAYAATPIGALAELIATLIKVAEDKATEAVAASPAHICKPNRTCCCSQQADEPHENCPVHGFGPWPPRCGVCGKFLSTAASPAHQEPKG